MAEFREVIKKFNKVRIYLCDFLVYGYKRRALFQKKSGRTYDDEKRRICSYLGEYVKESYGKNGKQISISMSTSTLLVNPLYRCYEAKSFTPNDIQLHFYLLDLLQQEEKMDLNELTDELMTQYGADIDGQLVGRKLKEYYTMGIFLRQKEKTKWVYSLAEDIFEDFRNDYESGKEEKEENSRNRQMMEKSSLDERGELAGRKELSKREQLELFLGFYAMEAPLALVGHYIQNSLQMKNQWFLFGNYFIGWTLEDEVLLTTLEAIRNRMRMEVKTFANMEGKISVYHVVPFFIMTSVQNGRRYIGAYHEEREHYAALRMDYIDHVEILNSSEEYQRKKDEILDMRKYIWGVSWSGKGEKEVHTLRFQVCYDEHREEAFYHRMKAQARHGQVRKVGKNRLEFVIWLYDVFEIMPWVRGFMGRICEMECSEEKFIQMFREDLQRMKELYGI